MMETTPDTTASPPAPRPRLLLHIGQPKTGTTALQRALHSAREPLLRTHGIYYPVLSSRGTHTRLKPHLLNALDEDARLVHQVGGTRDDAFAASKQAWEAICEFNATHQPKLVILSSEALFRDLDEAQIARLRAILDQAYSDIRIVAYLRDPVSKFLSAAQQALKIRPEFGLSAADRMRKAIMSYERLGYPLSLRTFADARNHPGGIVSDFAEQFLPSEVGRTLDQVRGDGPFEVNQTLSAEAMYLLQKMARKHVAAGGALDGDRSLTAKRKALKELDQDVPGFEKPTLKPEIISALYQRDRNLLWLRDERGITFDAVDYEQLEKQPADGADPMTGIRDVEQICPLNYERVTILRSAIPWRRLRRRIQKIGKGKFR
ncbi:MAG: hypothetical protein ABNH26_01965 [Celeribacter sp.]|jgi:hypothetical protein